MNVKFNLARKIGIVLIGILVFKCSSTGGGKVLSSEKKSAYSGNGIQVDIPSVRESSGKIIVEVTVANITESEKNVNLGSALIMHGEKSINDFGRDVNKLKLIRERSCIEYRYSNSIFNGFTSGLNYLAGRSAHFVSLSPGESKTRVFVFRKSNTSRATGIYFMDAFMGGRKVSEFKPLLVSF